MSELLGHFVRPPSSNWDPGAFGGGGVFNCCTVKEAQAGRVVEPRSPSGWGVKLCSFTEGLRYLVVWEWYLSFAVL